MGMHMAWRGSPRAGARAPAFPRFVPVALAALLAFFLVDWSWRANVASSQTIAGANAVCELAFQALRVLPCSLRAAELRFWDSCNVSAAASRLARDMAASPPSRTCRRRHGWDAACDAACPGL